MRNGSIKRQIEWNYVWLLQSISRCLVRLVFGWFVFAEFSGINGFTLNEVDAFNTINGYSVYCVLYMLKALFLTLTQFYFDLQWNVLCGIKTELTLNWLEFWSFIWLYEIHVYTSCEYSLCQRSICDGLELKRLSGNNVKQQVK